MYAMSIPHNNESILKKKTEFQIFSANDRKIIDFTEFRLRRYINQTSSIVNKLKRSALYDDYIRGAVAIQWCEGKPKYIPIKP